MNETAPLPDPAAGPTSVPDQPASEAALRSWLARYIHKRRSFLVQLGIATGLLITSCAVITAGAADAAFGLPAWCRWMLLVLCSALLLLFPALGARAARRVRRREALDEIESMIPEHGQLMRTALEEVSSTAPDEHPFRKLLRGGLLLDAGRILTGFRPERKIPWTKLRLRQGGALAALAACAALAYGWQDFRTALERLLHPSARVTFTTLQFVDPPEVLVAGREAAIRVKSGGRRSAAPLLTVIRGGIADEPLTMSEGKDGIFSAPLGKPETTLTLSASAGDGATGDLTIPVLFPPKTIELRALLTFPEYTGLPPGSQTSADIQAVEGTIAAVSVTTDRPVENPRLSFSDNSAAPPVTQKGNVLTFQAPLRRGALTWALEAEDSRGLKLEATGGNWSGLEDMPPRIEWILPKEDVRVTPVAEVTLRAKASDDFGLADTGVVLLTGGREKVLRTQDHSGAVTVSAVIEALAQLENEGLDIEDNVKVFAFARDRYPSSPGMERRGVTDLRNIDIRQFKIWTRVLSGGGQGTGTGGKGEDLIAALEGLIKAQRVVVNAVFRLREESSGASEKSKTLAETESGLSAKVTALRRDFETAGAPRDDLALLEKTALHLTGAVKSLTAGDMPLSWTHTDGALTGLLELRRKIMLLLPGKGAGDASPPHQEDAPRLPSLTELAREAGRLADEEDTLAKAAAETRENPAECAKLHSRQTAALADAGELFETLAGHPEATPLVHQRMEEAEKLMSAAGRALRENQPADAPAPLIAAAASLRHVATHLLGLEESSAAATLKLAAQMAQKAASTVRQNADKADAADKIPNQESGKKEKQKADDQSVSTDKGKTGDSKNTGSDSAMDAARDTATINDWLARLAGGESIGAAGARLDALRKETDAEGLSQRLAELANGADNSDPAEQSGLAGRLEKLAQELTAEHDRMVGGLLEKLAQAQAEARDLRAKTSGAGGDGENKNGPAAADGTPFANAKAAAPAAEGGGKSKTETKPGTVVYPRAFVERLREINDEELTALANALQRPVPPPPVPGQAPGDPLAKIEVRLETLLQEVIRRQVQAGKSERVPPAYEGLVENYFRRLSEDTGAEPVNLPDNPEPSLPPSAAP